MFVRIANSRVVEILPEGRSPESLFHPSLEWQAVDPKAGANVAINWLYADGVFSAPPPIAAPETPSVTLASLQDQIEALKAVVAAKLAPRT